MKAPITDPAGTQTLLYGTPGYRDAAKMLPISLEHAGDLLKKRLLDDKVDLANLRVELGIHYVIVNDCYVITPFYPIKKTQPKVVPLWGYYINGRSGVIRIVRKEENALMPSLSDERQIQLGGKSAPFPSPEWNEIASRMFKSTE